MAKRKLPTWQLDDAIHKLEFDKQKRVKIAPLTKRLLMIVEKGPEETSKADE